MKPSIFITRKLSLESPLLREFRGDIIHFSLLNFSPIPFGSIPYCDYIFFYSKNAVRFFCSQLSEFPTNVSYACMGKGTQIALEQEGLTATFVGRGKPKDVATQFLTLAKGKNVLFPRAENSKCSIQKALGTQINAIDLMVYKNTPKTSFLQPKTEILVFTSPLNAKTYFDSFSYQGEQVVSIGSTTTAQLTALNIPNILQSEYPSEASLLELIKILS